MGGYSLIYLEKRFTLNYLYELIRTVFKFDAHTRIITPWGSVKNRKGEIDP